MTPDAASQAVTTQATRPSIRGGLPEIVYIVAIAFTEAVLLFDTFQQKEGLASMEAGTDVANYWQAWTGGLYHGTRLVYGLGVYLYSPAFAQVFYPLTLLDFMAVRLLWAIPAVLAFAWLIWPAAWPYRIGLALIAAMSIATGNIEWLLCLVIVLGMRWPALWAIVALTKVTPALGLLWFAARREWRSLGAAIASTLVVVAVSVAFAPSLWFDWLDLLYRNATMPNFYEGVIGLLPLRLVAAAVIVWIGARRHRPEALVLGVFLATPDINFTTAALACALPRLTEQRRRAW